MDVIFLYRCVLRTCLARFSPELKSSISEAIYTYDKVQTFLRSANGRFQADCIIKMCPKFQCLLTVGNARPRMS